MALKDLGLSKHLHGLGLGPRVRKRRLEGKSECVACMAHRDAAEDQVGQRILGSTLDTVCRWGRADRWSLG